MEPPDTKSRGWGLKMLDERLASIGLTGCREGYPIGR